MLYTRYTSTLNYLAYDNEKKTSWVVLCKPQIYLILAIYFSMEMQRASILMERKQTYVIPISMGWISGIRIYKNNSLSS